MGPCLGRLTIVFVYIILNTAVRPSEKSDRPGAGYLDIIPTSFCIVCPLQKQVTIA